MSFIKSILGFLVLNVYFSYTLPLASLFKNQSLSIIFYNIIGIIGLALVNYYLKAPKKAVGK